MSQYQPEELLDLHALAEALGLAYSTAKTYRSKRYAGADLLPPADYVIGGRPAWLRSTVDWWLTPQSEWTMPEEAL